MRVCEHGSFKQQCVAMCSKITEKCPNFKGADVGRQNVEVT